MPNVGEQTCTAAPLSTIMATVASVLRSVDVIDATKSSSTFTEQTVCAFPLYPPLIGVYPL